MPFEKIPTTIIYGLTGSGKSSYINTLLRHHNFEQDILVIMNDFGEIQIEQNQGAHLLEVPAGCMCCIGNLPMSVKLTQALRGNKYSSILIELNGLTHIQDFKQIFEKQFSTWLSLNSTIGLIDMTLFQDERYFENEFILNTIKYCDQVIYTKEDMAGDFQRAQFSKFLAASKTK